MRKSPPPPRGRPRLPANTVLMRALVGKQDAMSRRAARKINELLASHVPAATAAFVWAETCRAARERFGQRFIDNAVQRIPTSDPAKFRATLESLIANALAELGSGEEFGPVPEAPPPEEPPARARRSTGLAEARAQSARLQTRLMDLRARIVPLDSLRKTTQHQEDSR